MLVILFIHVRLKGKKTFAFLYDANRHVSHHPGNDDLASEIGLQTAAEVSTLSDPLPIGVAPAGVDASTIESYSLDYDYQKAYQHYQPSVSEVSGSLPDSTSNPLVSADDDTLHAQYVADEQIEVNAPSGMLGLILETGADGMPTVTNVKPASPLHGQVHQGDRLLYVDEFDVSVMLASDVSRLIATRKNRAVRKFVFLRRQRNRGAVGANGEAKQRTGENGFQRDQQGEAAEDVRDGFELWNIHMDDDDFL